MIFSAKSLAMAIGILFFLSLIHAFKDFFHLKEFFRKRWHWIIATEFFALFLFMLLVNIRSFCADIQPNPGYSGAEKLGDMMIFTSLYKTDHFPPEDSWFCHSNDASVSDPHNPNLNYYYGGHLQWATLARLTQTPPGIAYNLALATLFSWIGLGAFSLLLNVTQRLSPAFLGGILIIFFGNLEPFQQLNRMITEYEQWRQAGQPFSFSDFMLVDRFDFWKASRVILNRSIDGQMPQNGNTVNEFPAFSFVLGDLHAHASALPLHLALLIVLYAIFLLKCETASHWSEAFLRSPGALFLTMLLLGGLYFYNSWEMIPVSLLLAVLFLWDKENWTSGHLFHILSVMALFICLFCISLFLFFNLFTFQLHTPFISTADSGPANAAGILGRVMSFIHQRISLRPYELDSSATELFQFWGLMCVPLGLLLASNSLLWIRCHYNQRTLLSCAAILFFMTLLGMIYHVPSAQICLLFCISAGLFSWKQSGAADQIFMARVMFVAFTIILFAELFVINDPMTGALRRYNTVFKLYYPAWADVFICACFFAWKADTALSLKGLLPQRLCFLACILLFCLLGLVYPFLAIWVRTEGFFTAKSNPEAGLYSYRKSAGYYGRTLDGLRFLSDPTEAPEDYAAIQWINNSISDRPHILEAVTHAYSYSSRISAYTGLPTILGWDNHEQQWRGWDLAPVVEARRQNVTTAYETIDVNTCIAILKRYSIRYVMVGELERRIYSSSGLQKFNQLGTVVYQKGNTVLYDVSKAPILLGSGS